MTFNFPRMDNSNDNSLFSNH